MVSEQTLDQTQDQGMEVIFSYTALDALEDGIFARLGKSNHLITNNLLVAMQKKTQSRIRRMFEFCFV